jgi:flavin-binding protein dodecin
MSLEDIAYTIAQAEQKQTAAQGDIAAAQESLGELQFLATIEGAQGVVDAIRTYTAQLRSLANTVASPLNTAENNLIEAREAYDHTYSSNPAIRQASAHTLEGTRALQTMDHATVQRVEDAANDIENGLIRELATRISFLVISVGRGIEWGDAAINHSRAAVLAAQKYAGQIGISDAAGFPALPAAE